MRERAPDLVSHGDDVSELLFSEGETCVLLHPDGTASVAWDWDQSTPHEIFSACQELLAEGVWAGAGVLGPEAFDPDPYLAIMDHYRIHHDMMEIQPGSASA